MVDNSSDEKDQAQNILDPPLINKIKLIKPILAEDTKLECSSGFSSSPPVIHFGGLLAGVELTQTLNIINRSSKSQRFLIIPPSNDSIHLDYEKKGHLAPGMAQKVIVRFKPLEFKYYYDTIRVRGEEDILLIPIHGYPLLNEVNFPNTLSFGDVPLCENAVRVIRLKCSIPVNFTFRLESAKLHPFFRVSPLQGIIPANHHIEVKITFTPIALGVCVMPVRLHIEQHGFNPIECVVSGRSVSGLIEKKQLEDSRLNLANHLVHRGVTLKTALGNSTFSGMTLLQNDKIAGNRGDAIFLSSSNHFVDPTAMMLANTFRTSDLQAALDAAIKDSKILHQKTPALPDGTLKALLPVKPRGPGSGLVFDAGSQWMSVHQRKQTDKKVDIESTNSGILSSHGEDHIINGLRVPAFLDHTTSVSYVLTQEEGKLKPKDLKIAIEKNRADRELKAKEQKKRQDQGGDAEMLDLRGILAEERLNVNEEDPFKRQLRELAFSMEVDDVRNLESEKEFRVSEEFIGTALLSESDVAVISHQRKKFTLHKKQLEWQGIISRQHSFMFSPADMTVRAGALMNVSQRMCSVLTPSFDANSNDVWSKRLNTLRRFVGLVSRWIYRKRSNDRMEILQRTLTAAGVTTWEEGREYVTRENATYRSRVGGNKPKTQNMFNPSSSSLNVLLGTSTIAENGTTGTVAAIVCSFPHPMEFRKQKTETILDLPRFATMPEMARRDLFPRFIGDEGSKYEHAKQAGIDVVTRFDDRSVLPLIVRPEYFQMEYNLLNCPEAPVFFPNLRDASVKSGALDEASLRPPADEGHSSAEIALASPTQSAVISKLCIRPVESSKSKDSTVELSPLPSWLGAEPTWVAEDLDFLSPRPNLRLFTPKPLQQETDVDWLMRPVVEGSFDCDTDGSLRTKWLCSPGFSAVNTHILGSHETRCVDQPPFPGPTITAYYLCDTDRHHSGLNCFDGDHHRAVNESDPDIDPIKKKQEREDVLTDSESDDEDRYAAPAPSMVRVRILLRQRIPDDTLAVEKESAKVKGGGKAEKVGKSKEKGKVAENLALITNPTENLDTTFSALGDEEIKEDQVELLRDRKTLELESHLLNEREVSAGEVAERLADMSRCSRCVAVSMPVQMPFHFYEDLVRTEAEVMLPNILLNEN